MRVDVETVSDLSAGQTVCDVWHQSSKPKNVSVAQVTQQPLWFEFCCVFLCALFLVLLHGDVHAMRSKWL